MWTVVPEEQKVKVPEDEAHLLVDLGKAHLQCLIVARLCQPRKDGEGRIDVEESVAKSALQIGTGRWWWSVHFRGSQKSVSMKLRRAR